MTMFEAMGDGELMQQFQEFLQARAAAKGETLLFRDIWSRYVAWATTPTDGGRPRVKSWFTHGNIWAQHVLPFWGPLPWNQCTLAKADEYRTLRSTHISERTGQPLKGATRNRELRAVQGALSWAVKRGLIPRNPLTGLQDEPEIHDRDFAITQEAFLKLLEHSRPLLQQFLVLLYETGCRRDEIRNLQWHEVDMDAGVIRLGWDRHKTGFRTKAGRVVVLSSLAMMTLEQIPVFRGNPYVFANPFAKPAPAPGAKRKPSPGNITRSTLSDWLIEARESAGVTGPKGQPIWYHTLRHTWGTDLSAVGLPMPVLMKMGGWKDSKTAAKYQNHDERHLTGQRGALDERSTPITQALHEGPKRPKGFRPRIVASEKKAEGDGEE